MTIPIKSQLYKSILIVGEDHIIPNELQELYEKEGYLIIGNGRKKLNNIDLTILKDKICSETRIDIWAHGKVLNGIHYLDNIKTEDFLVNISKYSCHPMHVHLHSCYAGAAANDVVALPVGSILVCHGENDKTTLISNNIKAIKQANENLKNVNSALDFANNIFLNTKHTATFSQNKGNDQIFKFVARSKDIAEHPEVLTSIEDIVRLCKEIQLEFIKEYNQANTLSKKIDVTEIHELLQSKAEEWARDYFIYLVNIGSPDLLNSLRLYPSKFESLVNIHNEGGSSPLFIAASKGYVGIVRELINAGADLNIHNKDGSSPLFIAASNGHIETVRILLEKGANPNTSHSSGWTPLLSATYNGHTEVVRTLLEKGANPNHSRSNGWTPLHLAAKMGYVEIVKELINAGANVNLPNKDGKTAYDISKNQHIKDILNPYNTKVEQSEEKLQIKLKPRLEKLSSKLCESSEFQEIIENAKLKKMVLTDKASVSRKVNKGIIKTTQNKR
jgi:hypothetical protein